MFGLQSYERLVNNLLDKDFNFSTDWEISPSSRTVLMRHDIDFSVEDAFAMAAFEKSINVCSTYFFMLSSNTYNVLSSRNRALVANIKDMGHKVSLHFDPTVHESLEGFLEEREVFRSAFDVDLDIVSIHRPGKFLERNNTDLFGTRQTYHDHFFKDLKYLSDSGGKDVFQPLSEFLDSRGDQALHFLIHPVWWVNKLPSQTETLNAWRTRNFDFITSEIRANCKTYEG